MATVDLADVYRFSVAKFGRSIADDYHAGLEAAIDRLRDHPFSGPVFPQITPPIRHLSYRRHRIFYDAGSDGVWIVRILHHAQDVGKHLKN